MGQYEAWAASLSCFHLAIHETAVVVPFLTISQRKLLLTQARCQILPKPPTVLRIRNQKEYVSLIDYSPEKPPYSAYIRLIDFAMSLDFFMNPLFSGLLSLVLRCAPHKHSGPIYEEIRSGKEKEITAAITPFRGPTFDYSCIFSPDESHRDAPLTPLFCELPSRRMTAKYTRDALLSSKVIL